MTNKTIMTVLLISICLSIPNATAATVHLVVGLPDGNPWWASGASVYLDGKYEGKTDSNGWLKNIYVTTGSHFINVQATRSGSKYVGQTAFDIKSASQAKNVKLMLRRVR